jgi:hypothetical protein
LQGLKVSAAKTDAATMSRVNIGRARRGAVVLALLLPCLLLVSGANASSVLITVQAESLTLPPGATVVSDPAASGGQAVRMTMPGSALTGQLAFSGSATSVAVYARGTKCNGGYPFMSLKIDATTVLGTTKVAAANWTAYQAGANIAGGTHTLALSDLSTNKCRYLYIDQIVVSGTSGAPPPTVSLAANPTNVAVGGTSTLTWSSTNATSCTASGGWSGSEPVSGSWTTSPLSSTSTFSLSCTGPGGTASQSITVSVTQSLNGLHVVGNKIVDGSGQTVVIHGVNKSGTEYACIQGWGIFSPAGSDTLQAIQAMKAWTGLNAVRIPLNEDCWLGINGAPSAYSGAAYQAAIENYVSLLTSNGLIAVLDLHWNAPGGAQATGQEPMPDADHATAFWQSVAGAFKNQGSVVFDLFNEPYPDSNQDTTAAWTCWRDGGSCSGVPYQAAGMQDLVNAVRGTGAGNLILLGGVEYANSLTGWLAYRPTDSAGNVAAAWHMYGGNVCSSLSCWMGAPASVAAAVPLTAGEFGENYSGTDCGTSLVSSFTSWMDSIGAGYVAWTWNHWGSCLDLVTDEIAGTPTASWGAFYKGHLASLP